MKKGILVVSILLGVLVFTGIYVLGAYNGLISSRETVDNKWAQVETQYQRRFDLIPNLVESVKGAMEQEKEVFSALAEARTRYAGAQNISEKVEAAGGVESALARLLVVMENYPELKSVDTVQTLMAQLEGAENRVSIERKRYNDVVRDYTLLLKKVPSNIVANIFGFESRPYFESIPAASDAPKVEF